MRNFNVSSFGLNIDIQYLILLVLYANNDITVKQYKFPLSFIQLD